MYILGFNCNIHNASAAIIKDGELLAASEEERFNRIKHDGGFPERAVQFCLDTAGIGVNDVDHVVFYWRPLLGLGHRAAIILKNITTASTYLTGKSGEGKVRGGSVVSWWKQFSMKRYFIRKYKYRGTFHYIPHHLCHAGSTFYPSGFDSAAILSVDFAGEWSSTLYGQGRGIDIETIGEVGYPHSLGNLYGTLTQFLGFRPNSDEYKVMGLASYGDPQDNRYYDFFRETVVWRGGGRFELDPDVYTHHKGGSLWYSDKMVSALGGARGPEEEITREHMQVAAALQRRTEEIICEMARYLRETTGESRLCMAGGVALNCVANSKVLGQGIFEDIHVHPAAHDAGTSVGGALYLYHCILRKERTFTLKHAYWGAEYPIEDCEAAAAASGYKWKRYPDIEAVTARLLAEGNIIGWYQGRTEWGPRALGNRSIIADPRKAEMKDIINRKVKHREPFRPFAPSVLLEHMTEYFDGTLPSPYMLMVYDVKRPDKVPAITHVDGTGRVQSVTREMNPRYYRLISEFRNITGVPVILNTSFNDSEEPIVNSPADAVSCFERTDIDYLVLKDILISRTGRLPS